MSRRIWSTSRKWIGNLVPAILSLPLLVVGLWLFQVDRPFEGPGLGLVLAFPVLAWFLTNWLSLLPNPEIRNELGRVFGRKHGNVKPGMMLVGVARPNYRGLLDPHEDVAFLWKAEKTWHVMGEIIEESFRQDEITDVRLTPNIHSLMGLGGWVRVDMGKERVLLFEPRERATLIGNKKLRKKLRLELMGGQKNGAPGEPGAPEPTR